MKRFISTFSFFLFITACLIFSSLSGYTQEENKEKTDPVIIVEEMPAYPGGDAARIKFLVENIKYPKEAAEKGIQGTVYVTFVVEKDGKISEVEIFRGIGGGCDEEALRIIKLMPDWKPGIQKGKPVRVKFNMPIKFKLGDSEMQRRKNPLIREPLIDPLRTNPYRY